VLRDAIKRRTDQEGQFGAYSQLGRALVRLGQDEEAINWLRAAKEHSSDSSPQINRLLAIAYGHSGRVALARREFQQFQEKRGSSPSARRLRHTVQANSTAAMEMAREIDGLVIAGLRDHNSENFDPGLPITAGVRLSNLLGPTPVGAPGVSTIKTSELRALVRDQSGGAGSDKPPLLLWTECSDCLDIAFPDAISVPDALRHGVLDDDKRRGLKTFVDRLLRGNRTRPLITMGWSTGWWGARNLAIELATLGYPNVFWYRGGLEAWDVAGLPVTRRK
jgi:adenylate cyclase